MLVNGNFIHWESLSFVNYGEFFSIVEILEKVILKISEIKISCKFIMIKNIKYLLFYFDHIINKQKITNKSKMLEKTVP